MNLLVQGKFYKKKNKSLFLIASLVLINLLIIIEIQNPSVDSIKCNFLEEHVENMRKSSLNEKYIYRKSINSSSTLENLEFSAIVTDGSFLYTCGTYTGNLGKSEIIVIKSDLEGNEVWNSTYGDTSFNARVHDIWTDGVSLYTIGEQDILGTFDIFIIKWYVSNGTRQWIKSWDMNYDDQGNAITSNGTRLFLCGSVGINDTENDVWVAECDMNGTTIWSSIYTHHGNDKATDIIFYRSGVYVTGYVTDPTNSTNTDVIVMAWDSYGSLAFINTFGSIYSEKAFSIVKMGEYFYTAGYSKDNSQHSLDALLIQWTETLSYSASTILGRGDYNIVNAIKTNGTHLFTTGYTNSNVSTDSAADISCWDEDLALVSNCSWKLGDNMNQVANDLVLLGEKIFTCGYNNYPTFPSFGSIIEWERNNLPIGLFSYSPSIPRIGLTTNFTFTGSRGNLPAKFNWDFGDGSSNSTEENPSHVFNSLGTFVVTLNVVDFNDDSDTIQETITVRELDIIPISNFTANATKIKQGEFVQFYFSGDPGDPPSTFQWNFGDGSINSTDENPKHQFNKSGQFDIKLTIIDADNDTITNTEARYITVLSNQQVKGFDEILLILILASSVLSIIFLKMRHFPKIE
ncbi:MAG: PKD domain-containing protein [Promethearchaeota archaeon]